jgi:transcriptional regulator with XRE-family HTH domain
VSESFGKRVRRLRIARRWSQQELSMRSFISTPHISSIERSKRQPSLEYAKRLADSLGVSLNVLCEEESDFVIPRMKNSTDEWPLPMQNFILNEAAAPYLELARKMSTLPLEDSNFLKTMIELLSGKRPESSEKNLEPSGKRPES